MKTEHKDRKIDDLKQNRTKKEHVKERKNKVKDNIELKEITLRRT